MKNPATKTVGHRNFFKVHLRPLCNKTDAQIAIKWFATQLDEISFNGIKATDLQFNNYSTLEIPSTFEFGLYKISVQITTNDWSCFDNPNAEDFTFVNFVKPPLVVVLLPGKNGQGRIDGITVTQNDTVTLKPGFASFYPNADSGIIERVIFLIHKSNRSKTSVGYNFQNFTKIEYYCRRLNESYPTFSNGKIDNMTIVGPDGTSQNNGPGCFKQV